MRAKIATDTNATQAQLIADRGVLHSKMTAELQGVLNTLAASFQQLQHKEAADYTELMGNLSSWQAAREIENSRQRAWLQVPEKSPTLRKRAPL